MLSDDFGPLLSQLLADADVEVVREAIRAAGQLRKRRVVPELLDHLADPRLLPDATDALARFGDSIVGNLRDQMTDPTTPWAVTRSTGLAAGSTSSTSRAPPPAP